MITLNEKSEQMTAESYRRLTDAEINAIIIELESLLFCVQFPDTYTFKAFSMGNTLRIAYELRERRREASS